MDESAVSVQQLPSLVKEWMQTEEELRTLSAAVREKRKRITLVRSMIIKTMKGGGVGVLNISAGAVVRKTTNAKAPMTKKYISTALVDFFNGDKVMADKCAAFLDEQRPLKSKDNLTLEPKS
jgi:hypothetical protein